MEGNVLGFFGGRQGGVEETLKVGPLVPTPSFGYASSSVLNLSQFIKPYHDIVDDVEHVSR